MHLQGCQTPALQRKPGLGDGPELGGAEMICKIALLMHPVGACVSLLLVFRERSVWWCCIYEVSAFSDAISFCKQRTLPWCAGCQYTTWVLFVCECECECEFVTSAERNTHFTRVLVVVVVLSHVRYNLFYNGIYKYL